MARLRAYRANKGKVYDLMLMKQQKEKKENRIAKLSDKVIKEKLKDSGHMQTDNIAILNICKRT